MSRKITSDVHSEFLKQIESDDLRKEFWLTSDYYAEKIKDKTSSRSKLMVLNGLMKNIEIELADGKKMKHSSVSLSVDSAPCL